MSDPVNMDEARVHALRWVRHLTGRGYTSEKAQAEIYMGYSGPGEVDYSISHGEISIPSHSLALPGVPKPFVFSFRQLAEPKAEQALLL